MRQALDLPQRTREEFQCGRLTCAHWEIADRVAAKNPGNHLPDGSLIFTLLKLQRTVLNYHLSR